MPERIQDVLLALAFLACGGHHILLRLLSLHLCNEYLSLPKKKKKTKKSQLLHADWAVVPAYLRFVWCPEGFFA